MEKNSIRKTKIIATIGPASDSVATLKQMIAAGMSVARLNLSFGSGEDQVGRVKRIRQAAAEMNAHVAIMADTKGIEIRTGPIEGDYFSLETGDVFKLFCEPVIGSTSGVSVSYRYLYEEVKIGTPILLDDGAIELEVVAIEGTTIIGSIVHGGMLRANKGVNLPYTQLSISAVSPETEADVLREMRFAVDNEIEYIAASFIQTADDIYRLKSVLRDMGADIPIIAKIENRAGITNLEQIVDAADGTMVARGDLGVELPLADVPGMQKRIIRTTVSNGKPVITATQMLASMENNPKPTRAEASDVANAILDGTSAVMLSGETAMGKYPVQAVKTMERLAVRAEISLAEYGFLQKTKPYQANKITEAVSQASITMAKHLQASLIICLTDTGFTARQISKHRPESPILAVTVDQLVATRLALNWGVIPLQHKNAKTDEGKIQCGIRRAKEMGYVNSGDLVVITAGHHQTAGGTDYVRVVRID